MLSQLTSAPIWLHILAILIIGESIASRLIIRTDTVDCNGRTPPSANVQRNIERVTWILTTLYLVVVLFFWMGHNWARILVLCGSAISLFNAMTSAKTATKLAKTYMIFDSVFSAVVIVCLLLPSVVAHFTTPK